MEYIQTILFQIPASRLEQAAEGDGLLPELDEHRKFLKGQVGFQDLRITRSINNDGNVLFVVETRWSDDSSLVRYETNEPNAATIVRKHSSLLVAGSLQVLDMEALRTESSFKHGEEAAATQARVILPVAIPLGVLAFALLTIYGLSRVYLEVGGNGAVALSTGIAIGVLIICFYFANNPKAPAWQIGAVVGILAITLAGGSIWAVANEDETHSEGEEPGVEEPGGEEPGGEEPGGEEPGGLVLSMGDSFFEFEGEREPTITVPAGTEISIVNDGASIHNLNVAASGDYEGCTAELCSDPDIIRGGQEGTYTVDLDAGEYDFRCDFHPTEMTGKLIVE